MKKTGESIASKRRLLDLVSVIIVVLIAITVSVLFKPNFLATTFLFFGLPSLFLLWRKPSNFKKSVLAAFLLGIVWGFAFDYVAEFNNAWGWSTNTNLSLPIEFFGVVSLDILIWYFLWVLLIVLFYEYFAEYDFSRKISPRYKWALSVGFFVTVVIVTLSKLIPSLLTLSYAYLVIGSLTLLPFLFIITRRPKLLKKVFEISPFFIFLYLSFEVIALYNDLWSFPGQYVGSVSVLNAEFPLEELLFWIVLSSAIAAAYHEFVVDDWK